MTPRGKRLLVSIILASSALGIALAWILYRAFPPS